MSTRPLPPLRLPNWVLVLLGLLCVALGVVLTVRPFASVEVFVLFSGIAAVVAGLTEVSGPTVTPWKHWSGAAWLIVGVVLLVWPNVSVAALAVVVGVGLIVTGFRELLDLRSEPGPVAKTVAVLTGLTSILFGILAASWPDVTVFVVGVLFGARLVWLGLIPTLGAFHHGRRRPAAGGRGWWWTVAALRGAAFGVALLLMGLSIVLHQQVRVVSPFYDWAEPVPDAPGQLLRSEPYRAALPVGSTAQLILYSTTASTGRPAVGSAIVLSPTTSTGPSPVILWDHGTTGIARNCAPSLAPDPFGDVPALSQAIAQGWTVVAPDYVGMGTSGPNPYLVGTGEAWSGLDAVRAARHLDLPLGPQSVVWGHSQGGHAALWTGLEQATYAPDVPLSGVAALAPATNVPAMAAVIQGHVGGSLGSAYVLAAYADTYPDVTLDRYVRAGALANVKAAAARCTNETGLLASIVTSLPASQTVFAVDPTTGPAGQRLIENTPTAAMNAPLLLAQGTADEVLPYAVTSAWVKEQCAAGHHVDFRSFDGGTHMSILGDTSELTQQLITWTTDRLVGKPPTPTC